MTHFETFAFFISRMSNGALLRLIDDAEASFADEADYIILLAGQQLVANGFWPKDFLGDIDSTISARQDRETRAGL